MDNSTEQPESSTSVEYIDFVLLVDRVQNPGRTKQ